MPSLIGRCGGGGGGGLTRWNGSYGGNNVNVGAGGFADLTWDTLFRGDAVLNLAAPSAPTVGKTGYWSIAASFGSVLPGLTAGAIYQARLFAGDSDAGGAELEADTASTPATATLPDPIVTLSGVVWLTSGSTLELSITNLDAVARNFALNEAVVAFLGGT